MLKENIILLIAKIKYQLTYSHDRDNLTSLLEECQSLYLQLDNLVDMPLIKVTEEEKDKITAEISELSLTKSNSDYNNMINDIKMYLIFFYYYYDAIPNDYIIKKPSI